MPSDELTVWTTDEDLVADTVLFDFEGGEIIAIGLGDDGNQERSIPIEDVEGIVAGRPDDALNEDPPIVTDGGTNAVLDINDKGQVWGADRRDLQKKLTDYYGHDVWLQGDWYDEDADEMLYEVLVYFDGDETHLITEDVPVFGHGPSGAAGLDSANLPSQEMVDAVVEAVEGGEPDAE